MSRLGFSKALAVVAIMILAAVIVVGCASRPEAAQKLYDRGQYQLVVEKYPDLEVARRARAKLAEKLLEQKDYETVLRDYRDTPSAYKATEGMAQKLFDAGRYQDVMDGYPSLPVAKMAREKIADSLFAAGLVDDVILRYGDTQKGQVAKEQRAVQLLAEAKKLRGAQRIEALTKIVSTYGGTTVFAEANELLAKAQQAAQKTGKPKQ